MPRKAKPTSKPHFRVDVPTLYLPASQAVPELGVNIEIFPSPDLDDIKDYLHGDCGCDDTIIEYRAVAVIRRDTKYTRIPLD